MAELIDGPIKSFNEPDSRGSHNEIIYANQVDVTSAPFICAILDRAVSRLDVYCLSEKRMGKTLSAAWQS